MDGGKESSLACTQAVDPILVVRIHIHLKPQASSRAVPFRDHPVVLVNDVNFHVWVRSVLDIHLLILVVVKLACKVNVLLSQGDDALGLARVHA